MYDFAREAGLDLEQLRARLRAMDDEALRRQGKAAAFLCRPEANHGRAPRETFVLQLVECRAEWKRRRVECETGKTGG